MKHYTARYNGHEQEIKQLLMDVASFDTSGDTPESALMIEAAEYIRQLEALNDLLVPLAQCGRRVLNDHIVFGMKETSVILCALRREATNQGATGSELSPFLSEMLYRIVEMIEDKLADYEELGKAEEKRE